MNRRELRRKRRRRNQTIAYIVAGLILAAIVFGCVFIVRNISGAAQGDSTREEGSNVRTEGGIMADEENADSDSPLQEQTEASGQTGISGQPEELSETEPEAQTEGAAGQAESSGEETPEEQISRYVEAMSLEDKVAGLFIITPEQLTGVETAVQAGESTKEALEHYPVGGLVYFARNIQSDNQLKEMLANTASYSRYPLFLGVDEEGGQVARVAKALGLENVGPMAEIGASGNVDAAYEAGAAIASYLKEYGFNLDFAPVADVLTNPDNTVIGDRSFGSDPVLVSQMVAAAVQGLQENGVSACIKHFPGHGNTAGIEAGVDMVMVGHISAPGLTDGDKVPASMNEKIITGVLREQLGYNGVVITDAMNMSAITRYYAADEAAVKALKAGADMILMPEDFTTAYNGVIAAVQDGTIAEERVNDSLKRIFRVKYGAGT